VNPWIEYLTFHGGTGQSRQDLQTGYQQAKQGQRSLIGNPYNIPFPAALVEKEMLCAFNRGRRAVAAMLLVPQFILLMFGLAMIHALTPT
jgi:hypothetical protein